MDIARLVLDYLQVLAWPTVAVLGILMFRGPLIDILRRLKGAGFPGGVSLDFDREVRATQELSRDVAKAEPRKPAPTPPVLPITEANARMLSLGLQPSPSGLQVSRYTDLSQQDPNLALAGLRMEIDILARNLAKGHKLDIGARDSSGVLLRRLLDGGAITSDQHALAQKIVGLCNAAVHGAPVSREEADAIIDAARVLSTDYLAWLSWHFDDGWKPRNQQGG